MDGSSPFLDGVPKSVLGLFPNVINKHGLTCGNWRAAEAVQFGLIVLIKSTSQNELIPNSLELT